MGIVCQKEYRNYESSNRRYVINYEETSISNYGGRNGSRYGGLKQIDPVDAKGRIIMDFSIFDAKRAGFEKVIFIIKKEQEDLFREAVGDRVSEYMEVSYAYQEINNIPAGFQVPEGRETMGNSTCSL